MKHYQASVPHVFIGMAAMAMTAATLALAVVAPAMSDGAARDAGVYAARGATPVDIRPGSIEVVAVRGPAPTPASRATI